MATTRKAYHRTSPEGMALLRACEAHDRALAAIKQAEAAGDPDAAQKRIDYEAARRVALSILNSTGGQ